jgi:hypothetical protein
LLELLEVLAAGMQHVPVPLSTHPDVPLVVHARYTRIEILGVCPSNRSAKLLKGKLSRISGHV